MQADPKTDIIQSFATLDIASVVLHVEGGQDAGKSLRLTEGTARIGTASACKLILRDPTVSRLHCELQLGRGGLAVRDSGSTNGTFVDGVRVHHAELVAGATMKLGNTSLRVEFGLSPIAVQLSPHDRFGDLLGASVSMRRLYTVLERVAKTASTVLIEGETGTGKELVARALHDASPRAAGPFVAVDCGSIAETLIDSELFGHVRGAFSGAVGERRGLFEEADGGTLFLDEIGELPTALQPKLLRALEAREVRRVGSNLAKKIDVRVVAATNRSLARSVNEGSFREDLYYRLAVVEVLLPPLRGRREDVPQLARHFYERFAGGPPIPEPLLSAIVGRTWPGNVRELRNFIERSVSLGWAEGYSRHPGVPAAPPPPALEGLVPTELPYKEAREQWLRQFELLYVRAILRRAGSVSGAARLCGLNRRSLQRRMAELGIRDEARADTAEDDDDENEESPEP